MTLYFDKLTKSRLAFEHGVEELPLSLRQRQNQLRILQMMFWETFSRYLQDGIKHERREARL